MVLVIVVSGQVMKLMVSVSMCLKMNQYILEMYVKSNKYRDLFQWICGKAYGQGVFTHSNGDKFRGEWKNNVIIGVGHFESKSGNTYTGKNIFD